MRNLFWTMFLPVLLLLGCGGDFARKPSKTTSNPSGGAIDYCAPGLTAQTTPMGTVCYTMDELLCAAGTVCASQPRATCPTSVAVNAICTLPLTTISQTGGTYTIPGDINAVGPAIPFSYTFLDTPNASLCVDAFYRQGVPLPSNAVAKPLMINTVNSKSLVTDSQQTTTPILTVIDARQCGSDVFLQLLNRNGFYCIVGMESINSKVQIQRSCLSQLASISPTTINAVPTKQVSYNLWWLWPHKQVQETPSDSAFFGNSNSQGSRVSELPCIP